MFDSSRQCLESGQAWTPTASDHLQGEGKREGGKEGRREGGRRRMSSVRSGVKIRLELLKCTA